MNSNKTRKRMIWMMVALGLLFGSLYGYHIFGAYMMKKHLASNARPPATVTAMKARYQTWQTVFRAVGTLRAVQGVNISPEIGGQVARVYIRSGQTVKKGQLLLELNHADDDARLRALQADTRLAEISFKRDKAQLATRTVSQAALDASGATLKRTRAAVAQQQALIAKKRIVAPFSGQIGVIAVNPGQYLHAADVVTTLQNTDALFVDFYLPQKDIGALAAGQALQVISDAWPGMTFDGRISAINSAVDASTRNVHIEGRIDHPDGRLHPGMFVSLRVVLGKPERYLTLPLTAVGYNAYGATVFIAARMPGSPADKPVLAARQEFVKLGPARGDQVAVLSGIRDGDMVVTSGLMKLKNGTPLIIDNRVRPANDVAPVPQEE